MKKAYYLSSCSTCDRILKEVNDHHFQLQDIKFDAITEEQIDQMYQFTNSYEDLFSKRARKYKSMGLKDQNLKKDDLEKIILCDLQNEIYPDLEKIFLKSINDAGFPDMKLEKKIDFEKLYQQRLN